MNIRRLTLIATAALLIAAAPRGQAAGFNFGDWNVNTSEFSLNYETGNFSSPSLLTLTRPGNEVRADRGTGNYKTKQATLTGHVWLHDRSGTLTNFAGAGGNKPATLTCDTLQIDGISKIYTAIGRVHFTQGASFATADKAVMNGITHDLHLYGHVTLHQ